MTTTVATEAATAGLPSVRPYESYVYAYPHKTAYRPLEDRPSLRSLWAAEPKDALSLYLHIPFCEVRCGFCNLFTRIGAPEELTTRYLDALERQAGAVRDALGDEGPVRFAAAAFGGGTPTFLTAGELERLCDIAEKRMGADLRSVPLSVETSPSTATADRLAVLADRGTTRISIGVQSFVAEEARAAVRPQRRADVDAALGRIREARIPLLNIDLIYGIDGQTERKLARLAGRGAGLAAGGAVSVSVVRPPAHRSAPPGHGGRRRGGGTGAGRLGRAAAAAVRGGAGSSAGARL